MASSAERSAEASEDTMIIFDDWKSYIHTLYAFTSVLLNIEIASTIAFVIYQYKEKEKWRYKAGDYVEYSIGLVLGGLTRYIFSIFGWSP